MTEPLDLTIAIPILNEEANLNGCLNSIGPGFAKKVVIIDSGSTDSSLRIAAQHNVEVIPFRWDGKFPKKRNWFLRRHTPQTKWVLFLDADEFLTENFKEELRQKLSESENYAGYWLSYSIYFLGKQLKGGYPLNKLAMFRVGSGEYERIEEENWSSLDMEIHEHPVLTGKTGTIKSRIDHRDFRGVQHYVQKHSEYAKWEVNRYFRLGKEQALNQSWTWKQRLKYRLMRSVFIGPVFFIGSFILMGGFRDGKRGLVFAILKMSYFTQIYSGIRERELAIKNNR